MILVVYLLLFNIDGSLSYICHMLLILFMTVFVGQADDDTHTMSPFPRLSTSRWDKMNCG